MQSKKHTFLGEININLQTTNFKYLCSFGLLIGGE